MEGELCVGIYWFSVKAVMLTESLVLVFEIPIVWSLYLSTGSVCRHSNHTEIEIVGK